MPDLAPYLPYLPWATLAVAALGLLFAALACAAARRGAARAVGPGDIALLLRQEGDAIRAAVDANGSGLRQETFAMLGRGQGAINETILQLTQALLARLNDFETRLEATNRNTEQRIDGIGQQLNVDIAAMGQSAQAGRETLRHGIDEKLDISVAAHAQSAHRLREELQNAFQMMRQGVAETLREIGAQQGERLANTQEALTKLTANHAQAGEQLRQTVEGRLDILRQENAAELEKVRATVDEKLQTTLEKRLGESFDRVVEQLNKAYEAFGEMRSISASVGDLKNVLTNPKLRGNFGEVQLAMLLQDFLAPHQYIKDAQVRENSSERVEYAIRLPGDDGDEILLPVDAKFPREDYDRMIAAIETGAVAEAETHRRQLETRIKQFAKDIARKYVNPPQTTPHAILFLPTESLFAEVLRQPGLFDHVLRECNVLLAGPTTFAAVLHAFQANHRSKALARQSGEVWKVLGAVRSEFSKYNEVVAKLGKQVHTVSGSVDEITRRARAMNRVLRTVDQLPDEATTARLLGLDADPSLGEDDEAARASALPAATADIPLFESGAEGEAASDRLKIVGGR